MVWLIGMSRWVSLLLRAANTEIQDKARGKEGQQVFSAASHSGRTRSELKPGCSRLTCWRLETSKDAASAASLGNLEPHPTVSSGKESPYLQCEPLFFQLLPILSSPPTMHCCEERGFSFSVPCPFPESVGGCCEPPPKPSLLQVE